MKTLTLRKRGGDLVEGFLDLNRPTLVEGELDDQRIRASPSVQLDQMVTV